MMRYFILLMGLCCITAGYAQSKEAQESKVAVSGVVRDAATGEPMVGVTITTPSGRGAVSNVGGRYAIVLHDLCDSIECLYLGYDSQKVALNLMGDTTINFALAASATPIDEVVVVGNMGGVGSQFGKVSVNMQQLKYIPLFMGEHDIFKYFQMLPGVVGGRDGSSEINIRGGGSDQTLVLLDDVPIYNQSHAMGFVSIFNGEALSGADLYKGGIPATIGGRLSGAVAMTTRDGNRHDHKQTLTIGTLTASALVEGPMKKGKGSYLVSGRYFTPNLLLNTAYLLANPGFQFNYLFYDITAKITYDLNARNTLSWSLYNGYDDFSVKSKMDDDQTGKLATRAKNNSRWLTTTSSLRLNTLLGRDMFLKTTLYYSGVSTFFNSDYNNYSDKTWSKDRQSSNLHEVGLRTVAEQKKGVHALNYGLHVTYQDVAPKDLIITTQNSSRIAKNGNFGLYTAAVFVDDNIVLKKWNFHVGLRVPFYFNNSRSVVNIEPRLGVSFAPTDRHSLFLSYDRNTQPLFAINRQFGGLPVDFWMPMRDDVLESSRQLSAGWKYKPVSWLFISIEAFYKQMQNLYFVQNEDEMLAGNGGYSLGSGYSYGGEMVVQYTGRTTMAMLSYSHSDSKRRSDGHLYDFQYNIPYNLNLYARQQTFRREGRVHYISMNLCFKAGLPYMLSNEAYPSVPGMDQIPNVPLYPDVRLTNYFRIDLNYSMEKKLKRGSRIWQLSILNLTNHANPTFIFADGDKFKGVTMIPIMPSFSYKRIF